MVRDSACGGGAWSGAGSVTLERASRSNLRSMLGERDGPSMRAAATWS
ncbi:hypothetical protein L2Y90_00315 [Burkholderia pyrrocinia]|nr:hypothetical protein [Burkholderia pyrrocinia]UVE65611.1 hypothetical protein L2Y90_00315 [Burkholderia pyrrocinia]